MGNGPVNWIPVMINAFTFMFSGAVAVATVVWKLAQHEKKITDEINLRISLSEKEQDKKVARIYERFDEYKNFTEFQFVRKDMCGIMHNNTAGLVADITLRIDGIDKKIDEIKDLIMSKLK